MIRRTATLLAAALLFALALGHQANADDPPCELKPREFCFGVETVSAGVSTTQAGAHPDLSLSFELKQDPETKPSPFGMRFPYSPTRNVRINVPPGLIGDPNVLGIPQQCTVSELQSFNQPGGGCPNGSQVGRTTIYAYGLQQPFLEPLYMMQSPEGDAVARLGTIAGIFPIFIDFRVRSESDYGLVAEFNEAPSLAALIRADTTIWGVPADKSHDNERCTPAEVQEENCLVSSARPPGSRPLPFVTNPTRCGVPLEVGVNAASWADPVFDPAKEVRTPFPTITGCNNLPFGPSLVIEPTNRKAGAPTGLDITARSPASDGVDVLEPSQARDIRVTLPEGMTVNPASSDGLDVCSESQAKFGERVSAQCPDAAKLAEFEALIPALPRRLKGAVYLREPEPGNLFRFWGVADDLGAHVKLQGQLNVDEATGQIESVLLDLPQAPLREVKLVFKSGFRAPLVNPPSCGNYSSSYEFTPWSGGPPVKALSPIQINEGCDVGGFDPKLTAGTTVPTAGQHSPFLFTLKREDGEQNPAALDITLPKGLAATFKGIPRCEGFAAETGQCPAASRVGKVIAGVGAGPAPLWVPQPGKRPTAFYLGGPYKGAPLSAIAVVPAQAGPFDLGDEVVRSAIHVDPDTVQGSVKSDPLPQIIEGVPVRYRTIHVEINRPGFTLNPTGCMQKQVEATVTSSQGGVASPTSPFQAANCSRLPYKPRLSIRLNGGTRRGAHPKLTAVMRPRPGDANFSEVSVALPRSAFLDQAHIGTVCTRVQFRADACPQASIYGKASATSPLIDEKLEGNVYLRSSSHELPDLVIALKGPPSLPIEVNTVGRVDSVNGGIRTTFEDLPDAPVSEVRLEMQGGNKGLLINSANLCKSVNRATAKFSAQNGRRLNFKPVVQNSCKGAKRKQGRR
jgi:hypothetical protein